MKSIKINCDSNNKDSIQFDAIDGVISADMFSEENGKSLNIGILFGRDDIQKLIKFLQDNS
jgi:hypothetical protein